MVDYELPDDANGEDMQGKAQRSKLWDLKPSYRCAVIGTCLTLAEVRKIARKAKLSVPENVNDGRLHSSMVTLSGSQRPGSKAVHRALDRKYKQSILKLSGAESLDELLVAWREGVKSGNVAGPLWSVMTHPLADVETHRQIYSDVHMMSHLTGRSTQVDIKLARDLEHRVGRLEEELVAKRQAYRNSLASREEKIQRQAEELSRLRRLLPRINEAERRVEELEAHDCDEELVGEVADMREAMTSDRNRTRDAESQLASLHRELRKLRRREARNVQAIEQLKLEQAETSRELEELLVGGAADPCVGCRTGSCAGASLSGTKILYVGGRTHLVRYYREAVERRGGEFLHHDGGVEDNMNRLHSVMDGVDVVMCSTDCVSHAAALGVKRACKSRSKPFVPLRNSSLSTLARGLVELEANDERGASHHNEA